MVHDHKLEIDDRCFLQPELLIFIKEMVMNDPEVRPSLIMRRLFEQTGKKIRHLDTLNALKQIRGDVRLDMKVLMTDIELLKRQEPDIFISIQRSSPLILFMQTTDMLSCIKCYPQTLLISASRKRKNKYGLFQIYFSTINNYGRVVVLAIGVTNIKCRQGYEWLFHQYIERANSIGAPLPAVVITNLDPEVIEAEQTVFTTAIHMVSQHFFLSAVKDVLFPYRKRVDFDYNHVISKTEAIVVEVDQIFFQRDEAEIMMMVEPLDLAVKEEIVRLFSLKTKWAIPFFAKMFTGGLHANERAAYVEGFYRMHHKYEHALSD